jgi:APA family basic amino acid/polyamine antiporter
MARDGLLPPFLKKVHPRFHTPSNAVIAQMVWSLVLVVAAYAWTAPSNLPAAAPVVVAAEVESAPPPFSLSGWIRQAFIPKSGPTEAFDALTAFVIFGGQIFYAMAVGAVFVLRWKRPELPRPYRTWGYPLTPIFYLLVFAAVLVSLVLDYLPQTILGSVLIVVGALYLRVVAKSNAGPVI